jgi:hypothetical protein
MAADGEIERLKGAIHLKNLAYDPDHRTNDTPGVKYKNNRHKRGR